MRQRQLSRPRPRPYPPLASKLLPATPAPALAGPYPEDPPVGVVVIALRPLGTLPPSAEGVPAATSQSVYIPDPVQIGAAGH
jgi:hypothetical protein